MIDSAPWYWSVAILTLTYLTHSSLFLLGAWSLFRIRPSDSPLLHERVWKFAALAGFLTTSLQLFLDVGPRIDFELASANQPWAEGTSLAANDSLITSRHAVPTGKEVSEDTPNQSEHWTTTTHFSHPTKIATPSTEGSFGPEISNPRQARDLTASEKLARARRLRDDGFGMLTSGDFTESHAGSKVDTLFFFISCFVVTWIILSVIRNTIQWAMFTRNRRSDRLIGQGPLKTRLDQLLSENGIARSVRLMRSTQNGGPSVFGWRAWTLLIPEGIEHQLDEKQQQAMLAHEIGHLVRGDIRWLWVGRVLCSCFAFQPLNFLARNRWQRASEYLCDRWAIEHGATSISLAKCLTQLASHRVASPALYLLSAVGTRKTILDRVQRLTSPCPTVDPWGFRSHRLGSGVAAVVVLGLVAAAVPSGRAATQDSRALEGPDRLKNTPPFAAYEGSTGSAEFKQWREIDQALRALSDDIAHLILLAESSDQQYTLNPTINKMKETARRLQQRRETLAHRYSIQNKQEI